MTTPRFSIAVAAYNYAHYLSEAVESVLRQDFGDYEILISDDQSKDDTFAVAQQLAASDPRIRCWRNEKNLGSRGNINKCYQMARGELVVPVQADDALLRPDHLSRVDRVLQANPKIGFVFCGGLFVTNDGRIARRYAPLFSDATGPGPYFLAPISRLPPWPTFTVIRRSLLQELGGEDESLVVADFELTMRLAHTTEVAYLAEPAAVCRVHDEAQGIRVGCASEDAVCRNNLACLDAFQKRIPADAMARAIIESTKSLYQGGHRRANNALYNAGHLAASINARLPEWREQRRRIAIYGGGEHTRRLFEWTELKPRDVICIIDQNPALHGTALHGCRIVAPEVALSTPLDVIVISSASQQDEIVFALELVIPERTELLSLYPRRFTAAREARQNLRTANLTSGSKRQ